MRPEISELQVRQCRYCKCTDESPCQLRNGDTCCWANGICDRCTNPRCLAAHAGDLRKQLRDTNAAIARARRSPWPSELRKARREAQKRGRTQKRRAA